MRHMVAREVKETHNMLRDQIVEFFAEARRWVLERENEGTVTTFYESRLVDETAGGGAKDIPAGRTCHPGPR